MKKLIVIFMCLVICFSFVGCKQTSNIKELSDKKLAEGVSEKLGVPDETGIEYSVTEMFYWDSAERYYKNVDFTQNGEKVAGASVDPYTGELLRNIWEYDSSK